MAGEAIMFFISDETCRLNVFSMYACGITETNRDRLPECKCTETIELAPQGRGGESLQRPQTHQEIIGT